MTKEQTLTGIAIALTIPCLVAMFRPQSQQYSDSLWGIGAMIEGLVRLLWAIPILFIWLIYFAVMFAVKG